jgi:hypothetical protein
MFELGEIRDIWGLDKGLHRNRKSDGLKSNPHLGRKLRGEDGTRFRFYFVCPRFRRFSIKTKLESRSALRRTRENAEKIGARRSVWRPKAKPTGQEYAHTTIGLLRD